VSIQVVETRLVACLQRFILLHMTMSVSKAKNAYSLPAVLSESSEAHLVHKKVQGLSSLGDDDICVHLFV